MEKELKKSYLGFVIWMLVFVVCGYLAAVLFESAGTAVMVRVGLNVCSIAIAGLALIIELNGKVYWYNGTTFEDALKAGPDRRKAFAHAHFMRFFIFAVVFAVVSIAAHVLKIPYGVDIAVLTCGVIVAALSTISIKL